MESNSNLKIHCFLASSYIPVVGAKVIITEADRDFNNLKEVLTTETKESGLVENISLEVPLCSTGKINEVPYGIYNIEVSKEGFKNVIVKGVQVFPNKKSIQRIYLEKGQKDAACSKNFIVIPEHKQVMQQCSSCQGSQSSLKLKAEPPVKTGGKNKKRKQNKKNRSMMRVLGEVEIPSVITVHCGAPDNSEAPNYTVSFIDYIKNVGSSELYSTWDSNSLRANLYCIISFVLNRVYTEWYPSRGYDFDITNDTAYDQAFVYGRTTYNSINVLADQLFTNYLERPGEEAPFFAQFCNGTTSTCPGWLSQWGSQYLAQNGDTPYEILTYYYGQNLNILEASTVNGYPVSFPGYPITLWMEGSNVRTIQSQLNVIGDSYPAIPQLAEDGIYGPKTENSVQIFQGIFDLPTTGIVNSATWYSISRVFVGVTNISN